MEDATNDEDEGAPWRVRLERVATRIWPLVFAGLVLASVVPVWRVPYPPIQDLPQHLAAIRILVDHGDPALRFADYFELDLGRTQYLAFYLVAVLLSQVVSVATATKLLITASLVGAPYALRRLLVALGRDPRLALFALPLAWNAHLVLGFLNFVAAIPLALLGLALAVELRQAANRRKAVALGALTLVCFYTHVVPFGFLGLGAALVLMGEGWRATVERWLPLVPGGVAMLAWTQLSPAGQATVNASSLGEAAAGPTPVFSPWGRAFGELPGWLTDVLHTERDEQLLFVTGLLGMGFLVAGRLPETSPGQLASRDRLALLAPLAALAYFVAPTSYDWIWPINARFPLLALLFLVPFLPAPRGLRAHALFGALAVVGALHVSEVVRAFDAFDDEVGELDEAMAQVPQGQRVAGLIFDRGSRVVRFSPFIHSVAHLQAVRGGAVMFTFADFPQSPIRYRDDARPPPVPPRWEWMPERVDPERDLDWYDWVLVRGGPGRIARAASFEAVFEGPRWSVWRKDRP